MKGKNHKEKALDRLRVYKEVKRDRIIMFSFMFFFVFCNIMSHIQTDPTTTSYIIVHSTALIFFAFFATVFINNFDRSRKKKYHRLMNQYDELIDEIHSGGIEHLDEYKETFFIYMKLFKIKAMHEVERRMSKIFWKCYMYQEIYLDDESTPKSSYSSMLDEIRRFVSKTIRFQDVFIQPDQEKRKNKYRDNFGENYNHLSEILEEK